jgi:hypothetical protein
MSRKALGSWNGFVSGKGSGSAMSLYHRVMAEIVGSGCGNDIGGRSNVVRDVLGTKSV